MSSPSPLLSESPARLPSLVPFDTRMHVEWAIPSYHDEEKKIVGCAHYRRGARIRAPCCPDFYSCRFCHDAKATHEINRQAIHEMICNHCLQEGIYYVQPVSNTCLHCKKTMAAYYCSLCHLFDDSPYRDIFHCDKCGLCRRGKQRDYWHCDVCRACYQHAHERRETHTCIENVLGTCPIDLEELFSSVRPVTFMPCGHAIHMDCLTKYLDAGTNACPLCKKTIVKDARYELQLEHYILANPMPAEYAHWVARILCNDCGVFSDTPFHFAFHRCLSCRSYNTTLDKKWEGPLAAEEDAKSPLLLPPPPSLSLHEENALEEVEDPTPTNDDENGNITLDIDENARALNR